MLRCTRLKKTIIALVFGLLSFMAFSLKAEFNSVIDTAYTLENKTRQFVNANLLRALEEGRADIIVLIMNEYDSTPHADLIKNAILELEAKLPTSKLPKKHAYLVLNNATHQGVIVLGKDVVMNESLKYGLSEIQDKILTPSLIESDINTAILLASQGMIGAFEEWPAHTMTASFLPWSLLKMLKWLAEASIVCSLFYMLRNLFIKPHWRLLPISDEATTILNEHASLEMAYWRTHRHIESV